jgi:hypothetical protein
MQVPKDPIEQLLANTWAFPSYYITWYSHKSPSGFIHIPSIILTSTGQPKFDHSLHLPSIMHMMAWQMILALSVAKLM